MDRSDSCAVLIGVHQYEDPSFPPVPGAAKSLAGMHQMLIADDLGGWPENQVHLLTTVDCRRVMSELRRHAQNTSGVLLLYFVGHGTVTTSGELVLAVEDTASDEPDITGLEYSKIRSVLRGSPAKVKAVVLDCCYSGRAIEVLSGAGQYLADVTDTRGTYTLTAADRAAHAGPTGGFTSFTGELLGLICDGVADGPPVLTFAEVYPRLRQRLITRGLPHPNQRGTDTADKFPLARNISDASSATTDTDHSAKDASASKRGPASVTIVEQPSSPHAIAAPVTRQPTNRHIPYVISWAGNHSLPTYTDPSCRALMERIIMIVLAVTLPGIAIPLMLHRIKPGSGQEDGWIAWFATSSAFSLCAVGTLLWLALMVYLHRTTKSWSLKVGQQSIEATDSTGKHEYRWSQVQGVTIKEIESSTGFIQSRFSIYRFTGLHIQFTMDAARSAPARPTGWPPYFPGEITVRRGGAVPICVLGPMTAHQHTELKEALARYGPQ